MPSRRRKYLPRDPKTTGLLREVRSDHRGYQSFGNTVRNLDRVFARDQHLYDLDGHLSHVATAWLGRLAATYPTRAEFHASRNLVRGAYPSDPTLVRDLRNVRYNPDGPVNDSTLTATARTSAQEFRAAIDLSAGAWSRKAKKRSRAQAWARFDEVLSSVTLASASHVNHSEADLAAVASGALR